MNLTYCNTTAEDGSVSQEEVLALGLTFHHLGLILAAIFSLIATVLSMFLMFMHATHYSEPLEQRYIIRILFMVPVYSVVSFLSFFFYHHTVYFEVLRDCYEAFAIASFFSLMCHYVAPDLHEQKNYFRTITPKPWIWPARWCGWSMFRTPRSGLTWFNVIWFCIFQYCLVRVLCTIVAVGLEHFDRYCMSSESPYFGHVWISFIEAVCVTIAMFCLIQFYSQLKDKLAAYNPLWKLIAIKAVIFLSFWQTIILSALTSETAHVISPGEHIAQPDLTIGIPSLIICIEMALFAVMHIFVYSWRPYAINGELSMQLENQNGAKRDRYYGGPMGLKAYLDAFNPLDILKAIGRGFRWLFVGRKTREADISYQNKNGAAAANDLDQGSSLGQFGRGKTGKYHKLDGADDQDIPLQSSTAPLGRSDTNPGGQYRMDPFEQESGTVPYDLDPPSRRPGDLERRPSSPYEAYRSQRKSRHHTNQSGGGDIGSIPPPNPFEPVPTLPGSNNMHSSAGQTSYTTHAPGEAEFGHDTGYHGSQGQNPWGSNRI